MISIRVILLALLAAAPAQAQAPVPAQPAAVERLAHVVKLWTWGKATKPWCG
ncbi:MAG TPA: hypothetical protein VF173_18750 [Thermoanaerobaculia bacterium]|nr:hypothetical protein [Thermoanaerobaculia bacterium]